LVPRKLAAENKQQQAIARITSWRWEWYLRVSEEWDPYPSFYWGGEERS
jgi:hypothetical protein